jgi:regulatory protein
MSVITSIKPQKNQKRVNIYLDGKFGFGLDLENYLKLNLKVEQEFSDKEIEKIIKKAEFQKTLDKLLRFATLRPRSEKEIRDWIYRRIGKKYSEELFNKQSLRLRQRLKRLEFLDDERFAKWWVGQRMQFKFKSKRQLVSELRIKGIDRNTIEDVIAGVNIDETKIAKKLIEKKKYRWEKLDKLKAKKKMTDFLARKGFGWDVIRSAIDVVLKKD